jgi:acetyl esterase/lipase
LRSDVDTVIAPIIDALLQTRPKGTADIRQAIADKVAETSPYKVTLPGKLGNPKMELKDDPRADPRMVAKFALAGMDVDAVVPLPSVDATPAEKLTWLDEVETMYETVFAMPMFDPVKLPCEVENTTKTIKGVDGNDILLFISSPKGNKEKLPCILHTHGGGMTILSAAKNPYPNWRDQLAAKGLVVVGVEFRNAGGVLGPFPFPAGLNDCYSALEWCNQNKAELNSSGIIISGESGGGNLCLSTAMKAKKEGKMDMVQGVYSQCPYILGPKGYKEKSTASLVENNGHFLDVDFMAKLGEAYDGIKENPDPLAWPSFATVEDLQGLPPHCISVNELDPLRDEGLDHARKLVKAGESPSRTVYQAGSQCIRGLSISQCSMFQIHTVFDLL